jgi:hypothetical protein
MRYMLLIRHDYSTQCSLIQRVKPAKEAQQ